MNLRALPFFNVASQVVAGDNGSAIPCTLAMVQGYFRGNTADRWLQAFDATALPANGTVPVFSYALPQLSPFSWNFQPDMLPFRQGLVFAVSTTEGALTISADTADFIVYLEEYEMRLPVGYSTVGDLTTGVDYLQVYTEATGAAAVKKLYQVDVINGTGSPAFLCFFGITTPAPTIGDVPLFVLPLRNVATTQTFRFGKGFTMQQIKRTVTGSVIAPGAMAAGLFLYVGLADASGNFPGTVQSDASNQSNIRAFYS